MFKTTSCLLKSIKRLLPLFTVSEMNTVYMVTVSCSICMCLSSTFGVSDIIHFLQATGAFMKVSSASYIQVQH